MKLFDMGAILLLLFVMAGNILGPNDTAGNGEPMNYSD